MNAPKRPAMPARPARPTAAPAVKKDAVEEVETVVEETTTASAPVKPSRPGRPAISKPAPVAEETVEEDDAVEETTEEYVADDMPEQDEETEESETEVEETSAEEVVQEEAVSPAPKKPGRPAAAKPAAEKAPKKAKEPKAAKEKEVKIPGERRMTTDALLEGELAAAVVDSVMQREDGESPLKAVLATFETDQERYDYFVSLNREMNDYLLAILATNSVPMFHNDVDAGFPVYKRVAPGRDVVRNPSSTEFPANLVEGRVTVFLQRNGIPLRAVEGTSTRLTVDQAAAEKDALKK